MEQVFVLQVKGSEHTGPPITYPVHIVKPEMKGVYNFTLYNNPGALLTVYREQIAMLLPLTDEEFIQMENQLKAKQQPTI